MKLASATPVLRVADYPEARAFMTSKLGFTVGEEGGDPPRFGIFHRDDATVFVDAWHGADNEPSPGWRAYVHVDDVDALAAELREKSVRFSGPADKVYGMREVEVADPSGNLIAFGQDLG